MKVKMLSRNPDNYVRETKLDLQRGETGWQEGAPAAGPGVASVSTGSSLRVEPGRAVVTTLTVVCCPPRAFAFPWLEWNLNEPDS